MQDTPATLALEWEKRAEKKLPVRVQLSGAADSALELAGKPTASPSKVSVSGPSSVIDEMTEVLTEPISVTGLAEGSHRRRVPLLPMPKHVTAQVSNDINVDVVLEAKRAQRRLRRLPVSPVGVGGTVSVRPIHVDVVVAAPERMLEELDPEHVVPVIELAGTNLAGGVISVPVSLRGLPEGVKVLRVEPSEVLVRAR